MADNFQYETQYFLDATLAWRARAPPWITVLFFHFKYLHQLKLRSLLNLYPNGGVICFSELPPKPSDKDDAKTVISGVGGWISILSNGILDSSVCCEVILRVRGLALDISIEGAVRSVRMFWLFRPSWFQIRIKCNGVKGGGGGGAGFEVGSLPQYPNKHDSFELRTSFKIIWRVSGFSQKLVPPN